MKSIIFKSALLATGWADNVKLSLDPAGYITNIERDYHGAEKAVDGFAMPGMNNIHSHAFQRAMAGLAEYSTSRQDSFWTWRDIMYRVAGKITAADLRIITSQLYVEMLKAGYISVSEFHYLHHDESGNAAMSHAIMEAAQSMGIALCHLPVLYMSSGFGHLPLTDQQRRFAHSVDEFIDLTDALSSACGNLDNMHVGMAFHSLRAVPEDALKECLRQRKIDGPVHIHISEQKQEVTDSIAHSGLRPVEWIFENTEVDENWCLIHATHITDAEAGMIAKSGAVVGLCPTTEANLGDGIFPLNNYLESGGEIAIGSDSHISVSVIEELRLLEYGQRLIHQRRNISADEKESHTGTSLYLKALRGGARASGFNNGVIDIGKRADIIVLDDRSPLLAGTPKENMIDRFIFSGNVNPVKDVYVAGNKVISDYKHENERQIAAEFAAAMMSLQKILD